MAIATKMDDREIRNRLHSLGSSESDTGPLRSLKPSASTPILQFIKDFYDDLFRNPDFAPIVRPSGATQDRLEDAPAGYARSHLDGFPDLGGGNRRAAIGPPHARINSSTQRPDAF